MSDNNSRRGEALRVALAGAGMISHYHLLAWSRLGGRVNIVAIADPDRAKAEQRARAFSIPHVFTDVAAMLAAKQIDALDVASPRETHVENVELAAARGIDVLCQKPLAPTLALSEALIASVADRARLMIHENWRFRPWYREIKRWLDAGLIGQPLLGNMSLLSSGLLPDVNGQRPALERQPFMARETRFLIAEALIHQIDVVRWLLGPLRVVGARATRSIDEVSGETLASIFMENADGAPVLVTGTMAAPGFPPKTLDRFELIGTQASISLSNTELKLLGQRPKSEAYDFDEAYQASFDGVIAHFVDCLESGNPFETNSRDNLETLRLVEHAYWAAGLHDPSKGP
jgi:predicted dehydrogenase